jgi:hypothetical protein
MMSGSSVVERRSIDNVAEVRLEPAPAIHIGNWSTIPSGTYSAVRHVMQGSVTFATPFIETPAIWARTAVTVTGGNESYGAGNETEVYEFPGTGVPTAIEPWEPSAAVASVTPTGATLETNVYLLEGQYWWPTTPSGARLAFTAAGRSATADVPAEGRGESMTVHVMPNPAYRQVECSVALPSPGTARVGIYDISGRLVKELVNGAVPAGRRSVFWDGKGQDGGAVASGVYFARVGIHGMERNVRFVMLH